MNMAKTLIFLTTFTSLTAQALTIDIRHDYFDKTKKNRDRIMLSHLFDNKIGVSMEQRFYSTTNEAFDRMSYNGGEYSIYYKINTSNTSSISPGFTYDRSLSTNAYKPYITYQYRDNDGLSLNLRARYERIESYKTRMNSNVYRFDIWAVYAITEKTSAGLAYMVKKSDAIIFNKKHYDYLYNGSVSYKLTNQFSPYVEVGNVSTSRYNADRETRYRVGFKYNF